MGALLYLRAFALAFFLTWRLSFPWCLLLLCWTFFGFQLHVIVPKKPFSISFSGQVFLLQVHITLLQTLPLGVIIHLFVQLVDYCLPQHIGASKALVICFCSTHDNIHKTKYGTLIQWRKVNAYMSSKWIVKGINELQVMVWLHAKVIQKRSCFIKKIFKIFSSTLYQTQT